MGEREGPVGGASRGVFDFDPLSTIPVQVQTLKWPSIFRELSRRMQKARIASQEGDRRRGGGFCCHVYRDIPNLPY